MSNYDSFDRCVLLLSGGLDSTVLLHDLLAKGKKVHALSFNYGQNHAQKEGFAALRIANKLGVPWSTVYLTDAFSGALIGGKVPHGPYDDAQQAQTVVPNRNMVMLSIAAAHAIGQGIGTVCYAAHADDNAVYPDCRPDFIKAMEGALALCHYYPIRLYAPFAHMHKRDIVALGRTLNVDFDKTWSCYEGGDEPCGKCGACDARKKAFQ
jgi:7-cyano-7-deazaguanine synthase